MALHEAIFKTAQHCRPNWLFKSACLRRYFTGAYTGNAHEDISTPSPQMLCFLTLSLAKIVTIARKRHINAGFSE